MHIPAVETRTACCHICMRIEHICSQLALYMYDVHVHVYNKPHKGTSIYMYMYM